MNAALSMFFTWQGKLSRRPYLIWGLCLFTVKYLLDRAVTLFAFHKPWYIWNYFVQVDFRSPLQLSSEEQMHSLVLIMLALPFILLGLMLCVRRLRDAGINPFYAGLFFLPYLNLIFFIVLASLPPLSEQTTLAREESKTRLQQYLSALIPKSKWANAALAVGLAACICVLFAILSFRTLGEYGWGLFVGTPFFLGFSSTLLFNYHEQHSLSENIGVATASVVLFAGLLVLFAMEGVFCLLMAFPIGWALAIIGATFANLIVKNGISRNTNPLLLLHVGMLIPSLLLLESTDEKALQVNSVTTSVIVNAPPKVVWNELVSFGTITEEPTLLLRTGVAYPIRARLEGQGVGAVRYCEFTTGAFVEPITIWQPPYHLAFGVLHQPPPLIETTFYDDLHLPHLEGYFQSKRGEFRLTQMQDGKTLLQGTTWYTLRMTPTFYWQIWSDMLLHAIHGRVLNHIRIQAETKTVQ